MHAISHQQFRDLEDRQTCCSALALEVFPSQSASAQRPAGECKLVSFAVLTVALGSSGRHRLQAAESFVSVTSKFGPRRLDLASCRDAMTRRKISRSRSVPPRTITNRHVGQADQLHRVSHAHARALEHTTLATASILRGKSKQAESPAFEPRKPS
ncbi:hypothetical protein L1887_49819 [Cichorium endivia]|nr:hypothetical protein L1887_49819 [Cichorium endivia]